MRSIGFWGLLASLALINLNAPAKAADYSVAPLAQPAPAGELDAAVAEQLSPTGFVVKKGTRTLCEIWTAKTWTAAADFKPSNTVIYPLEMGELLGVVRYARKGGDFRGQEIPKGVYTLRYALQPQDGNHVGTSDTRDFVLLLPAADDASPETMDKAELFKLSPKTAGGTHPAMLCLLASAGESAEAPEMTHDESRELWSVRFSNPTVAGEKPGRLTIQLVVVGRAAE
ncbi:MAG TPA: hypothetical protein VMV10_06950 [Pirellulales bacterium]|nr:hypothetical protein [Pirellulales bacterium]